MQLNYINAFFQITKYELKILSRCTFTWITPLLFYIMVVCLFPLAIGYDQETLINMAPGVIWVTALLATIISMHHLFRNDFEEGYIDLLLTSTYSLNLLALAKITSHWISHGLPLILISPLLGLLLNLSIEELYALTFTLILGTPALSLVGAIGAALTVTVKGNGLLLPMLIIPFYIPVLVFGTGILLMTHNHDSVMAYYALMGAFVLLSLIFAPFLTAQALKIGANA